MPAYTLSFHCNGLPNYLKMVFHQYFMMSVNSLLRRSRKCNHDVASHTEYNIPTSLISSFRMMLHLVTLPTPTLQYHWYLTFPTWPLIVRMMVSSIWLQVSAWTSSPLSLAANQMKYLSVCMYIRLWMVYHQSIILIVLPSICCLEQVFDPTKTKLVLLSLDLGSRLVMAHEESHNWSTEKNDIDDPIIIIHMISYFVFVFEYQVLPNHPSKRRSLMKPQPTSPPPSQSHLPS